MSEDPTRTRTTDPTRERRPTQSGVEDPTRAREPVLDPTLERPPADPTPLPVIPETVDVPPQPAPAAERSDAPRFGQGTVLRDRYQLESMIGKGAMGQVWKAKDLLSEQARDRNPYVAIKVLSSDFEGHPQAFVAMHREASRAQQLAHPNVVTVYTFDRDQHNGRIFIAMELLSGRPLDRVIRDSNGRGLSPAEAWPVITGMAEGLAYAHRKGIVHSDFKPANVYLTGDGVPKVLDFGIARAAKQADAGVDAYEDDSVMSGYTVTYAAPEVFDNEPPHTADDVFALGVVAYELLTGKHPFDRRPANEARADKLRPQPIKGLSRRQWRALDRALAFDRATRWQDAGAFIRALPGVTRIQIALAAAVAVLSVTAGTLWYRSYTQSLPAVPFEALPLAEQQYVQRALVTGNEAMELVIRNHVIEATADAADSFADAYEHHPRNPDAVAGLEDAADHFIEWSEKQPDREAVLRELRNFQQKSPFYAKYGPLTRAIEKAESK